MSRQAGISRVATEPNQKIRSKSGVNIRQTTEVPHQAKDKVRTQSRVSNKRSGYKGIRRKSSIKPQKLELVTRLRI